MAKEKVTRRLAAIFVADMVGYSRLMEADEEGTIVRQKAHRKELIDPKISEHDGRIVKTTGDGMLVEFASVVDAVKCAVEVQQAMAEREADVPADRRITYRVGINLGDIVIEGDDIFGDGVNVAARLETLAKPGKVLISGTVFDQLKKKLDYGYRFQGARKVKNIAAPVRIYSVLPDAEAGTVVGSKRSSPKAWRWATAGLALIVILGALVWWQPWAPTIASARPAKTAFPLPKKPSIAVLPFRNLTGDTTQEHLANGLTEDIITTLARMPRLFVIARRSSSTFKSKPAQVRTVAEKLGVRFVLEGGVQRTKDRVRINAQLVDAVNGRMIWAHRYDRAATDLLKVKDEIIQRIAIELLVVLTDGEQARIGLSITRNLAAWEALQSGTLHLRKYTRESNHRARQLYLEAIRLDPSAIQSWTSVGWTHWFDARFGWSDSRSKSLEKAMATAHRTLKGDPNHGNAYRLLGGSHLLRREYDKALTFQRKSIALEPNGADNAASYAFVLNFAGQPKEAIVQMQRAMRLSPYYPAWYPSHLGLSYHLTGQYDKALAAQREAAKRTPRNPLFRARLAALYADMGRMGKARAMAAEVHRLSPKHTIRYHMASNPFKDAAVRDRWITLLRKAGLRE